MSQPPPRPKPPELPKGKVFRLAEQPEFGELDADPEWKKEWQGMPEFISVERAPFLTVYVHFEKLNDVLAFSKLIGQKITTETRDIKYTPRVWFPKQANKSVKSFRYVGDSNLFECPGCGKARRKDTERDYCGNPHCEFSIRL